MGNTSNNVVRLHKDAAVGHQIVGIVATIGPYRLEGVVVVGKPAVELTQDQLWYLKHFVKVVRPFGDISHGTGRFRYTTSFLGMLSGGLSGGLHEWST